MSAETLSADWVAEILGLQLRPDFRTLRRIRSRRPGRRGRRLTPGLGGSRERRSPDTFDAAPRRGAARSVVGVPEGRAPSSIEIRYRAWLGTIDIAKACELRTAGLTVPILTWLNPSGVDAEAAAADEIDIAIGSVDELEALLKHASSSVRVHLNLDTGMGHLPLADQADPEVDEAAVVQMRHARAAMMAAGFDPPESSRRSHLHARFAPFWAPCVRSARLYLGCA